jgi:hypothetical protein
LTACPRRLPSRLGRASVGLAAALAAGAAAAAPAPEATLTCTGSAVGVCSCPQLDPARHRLVSLQATLSGATTVQVTAKAPTVGERTVTASGLQTLDLGGRAFHWPASGSATVLVGPSDSTVKMISGYDPKTVSMPGGTAFFSGVAKARTSFALVYTYVPRGVSVAVLGKPPKVPAHPVANGPIAVDPRLRLPSPGEAPASAVPPKPSGALPATVACTPG